MKVTIQDHNCSGWLIVLGVTASTIVHFVYDNFFLMVLTSFLFVGYVRESGK